MHPLKAVPRSRVTAPVEPAAQASPAQVQPDPDTGQLDGPGQPMKARAAAARGDAADGSGKSRRASTPWRRILSATSRQSTGT